MKKIRIVGWRPGFDKVLFQKHIRLFCEMSLSEAKHKVDDLLSGRQVDIILQDELVLRFIEGAVNLGIEIEE